jgi:hypothetical protein
MNFWKRLRLAANVLVFLVSAVALTWVLLAEGSDPPERQAPGPIRVLPHANFNGGL